jgi:hypothetical protein
MSTRLGGILLFAGVAATLSGQDFPWYLSDHYPARGATGVPTSISIMLEESRAVIEGAYLTGTAYSLKSQAGAVTALQNTNVYWTAVSIAPASPLAASTRYTFTITPPASLGDPYSFDFTTGSGPDRTAPQLIGFDPPSGTSGTSVAGPFTARFTMGPYQVQFVTGAAAPSTGSPKLLSTSPQANADGVDVNTAISFTFDAPLSPLAAISGFTVSDSVFGAYPAAATVADGTLTIKPAHPLLHDSAIRVTVSTTDIAGQYASAQFLFRTGPFADSSPFQVTAVSPPDGATINGADSSITLTFSKAVNPASLTSSAITVYSNGHPVQPKVVRANQDLSLVVRTPVEDGSSTLVVDPELTDIAGNPAIPFRAAYTFSSAYLSSLYRTSVKAMRPPPGSSGVPANTAISLFFSKPVDLAAMRTSLVVVADGLPAAGTMELSADGTVWTFRPTAPFPRYLLGFRAPGMCWECSIAPA